ncbi:acyl-CoA thioesterase [Leptobacterium flavescens]|uniref:Acyl-CoA thioesterase n=1 Tax=Leptobacterium flavescens TaxID=472055 RepID=A0A6P0UNA1_9FLAO|nr:thioesterase family protein [Leptobacterium flavescens]NER13348.1 acyl-CoA thioesterase [Leptobacterium flavescens]
MVSFEKYIRVVRDDLDDMEHVNNVRYLQWVQDIAKEHWQELASPALRQKYAWVVLSHHIEYKAAALLDDEIRLKTYVERSGGVTSTRIVEMYAKDTSKMIVKAETNWCLLDMESKKPTRIPEEILNIFHH